MYGKNKKRIYVSGKITGLKRGVYIGLFKEAEEMLKEKGYEVVNPVEVAPFGNMDDPSWSDYMRADIAALCRCDEIFMLENWSDSKGAKIELKVAEYLGMVIKYEKTIECFAMVDEGNEGKHL